MAMPTLTVRGEKPQTSFDLLGYDENSITAVVAWALFHSPSFLQQFLVHTIRWRRQVPAVDIRVQEFETERGVTDLELVAEDYFHLIVEAKRGWALPGLGQLDKYARRVSFAQSRSVLRRIITLSECSSGFAEQNLPATKVRGIPVIHISWQTLFEAAKAAHDGSRGQERALLADVLSYLGRIMKIQNKGTSLVYVVSLSTEKPRGWGLSWIDVVEEKQRYFHPIGGTWPKEPPTYIAFRYHGQLQTIHFITDYRVITDLHQADRRIPSFREPGPFFLYKLGLAIRPQNRVRSGVLWNGRAWCAFDLLLTSKTVREARDLTKLRFEVD